MVATGVGAGRFFGRQVGQVLPGLALDADMRFPFYRISDEIEKVTEGEGRRIDAYLQLKVTDSEVLRGKILIDSPGFDADAQRTSTLKLTSHIMDISDLVLVFFDARHPEPGSMQDTLQHLVEETINRNDSNKFLFILNQIDSAAREDNTEEIVAAWQRALSQKGLTAGRFFTIYNKDVSVPIEDEARKARFEAKRDADMAEALGGLAALVLAIAGFTGTLGGLFTFVLSLFADPVSMLAVIIALLLVVGVVHFLIRPAVAAHMSSKMQGTPDEPYTLAFANNTRFFRSVFSSKPAGWNGRSTKAVDEVIEHASDFVESLNDQFTNPPGQSR